MSSARQLTIGFPRMYNERGERRAFLPALIGTLAEMGMRDAFDRERADWFGWRSGPDHTPALGLPAHLSPSAGPRTREAAAC